MKVEEAQWTVRKMEMAISVSLFWPSFSADRGVNSSRSMASRRKRHHRRHWQHKKCGKHITNLGPTVSEKKQNRLEAESVSSTTGNIPINADSLKAITSNTLQIPRLKLLAGERRLPAEETSQERVDLTCRKAVEFELRELVSPRCKIPS